MAFHSSFNDVKLKTCCNFVPLPFRTKPRTEEDEDDIIDEAIRYYRVNIFFKNYEVQGPADRLLIFLTVYITHCLRLIDKETTAAGAAKKLASVALEGVPRPSEPKFFMNSIFQDPKDVKEAEQYQSYLKALKDEVGKRLVEMLYTKEGRNILFKFWMGISKRKFLNMAYEGI